MKKGRLLRVMDGDLSGEFICWFCWSSIGSKPETLCPNCGTFNEADNPKELTEKDFSKMDRPYTHEKEKVYALAVESNVGTELFVFKTEEGATNRLYNFILETERWDEEYHGKMPDDKQKVIDTFFKDNVDDYYWLERVDVRE